MRLYVGPVPRDGVVAWAEWAHSVLDDVRNDPRAGACLSARVLDDIEAYVAEWERTTGLSDDAFRWQSDVHPDDLEYLTNALYNLDLRLAADGDPSRKVALSAEGRVFHLVLVRALLTALAHESPSHAAFVDQIRTSWPTAAEVH
ncbi:MAG TPA: hypothetical protein VHG90_06470 [Acidimicrobiales bacterium]|nr:hypothetical protein [Acidimicrobiales bacterium]